MITTSLFSLTGIMVNKVNHPQMALIQVSEILSFTQIYGFLQMYTSSTAQGGGRRFKEKKL